MVKKFRSKVSYGLLIVVFGAFFGPLIPQVMEEGLQGKTLWGILILVVLFGFVLHLFFMTEYTIDGSVLKIKSGFFSYKPIEIASIKKVRASNSILSSPAASLDRIAVSYGQFDQVLLSPIDKIEFVAYLQKINPNIENEL